MRTFLRKTPIIGQLTWLQSLPARLVFTVAILALLAIPLAKSFTQFKEEITRKHQEARLLNLATRLCEERLPGKEAGPRCYVGHLDLLGQGDHIEISLRVFTRKPYSEAERSRYDYGSSSQQARQD